MKPLARLALALLAILLLVAAARALAGAPAGPRAVGPTGVVLPAADPMATEMQAEIERSQRSYAALFARLARARSEAEAFEVQEEMREQRTALQVELLRIQAAHARRAGRERLALQLELTIAELVAPEGARRSAPAGRDRL